MTDIASALAAGPDGLGEFEGRTILSTTIQITNAGDGLSAAMKVDPIILHHGEKRYVVLEVDVDKIRFDPIKDTQGVARVHVLKASTATFIDAAAVEEAIEAQREKIDRANEKAQGITRLPLPDELMIQHGEGEHADGLVDGCPTCDDERDAIEAEGEDE